ncbi:hypothetical protein VFPPC_00097 [Pochonia chlamydosporia 170]|uniref:Uncharacterized protein n=1 Tax=Pochonia chlamydosporia 170 TaxID=1380566 RepID=A0A179G4F0_METCM|nr:hypothetical protein VFPPC_00097 [Pochonia chlamydosporia 170]OAQ72029.1 hypothetical protein VFPPC_00097 [Pochonia chlamydosporia 170]
MEDVLILHPRNLMATRKGMTPVGKDHLVTVLAPAKTYPVHRVNYCWATKRKLPFCLCRIYFR